jgi:hypothetical protein
MNRRHALAGLAAAASGVAFAPVPRPVIPGAIPLTLGNAIKIAARSSPVKVGKADLHIIRIGTGTFDLDKDARLTAKLKAGVTQFAEVEYWISAAVFDKAGKLLGTAQHKEKVQYIRLGAILTLSRDIELDFGISRAFKDAALVAVAISQPEVPGPG